MPSKPKDASLAVEIQQLRDLVQSQAREWESQRAALRKAIGEQQQEIENLRQELQVSRAGSASVAAERASVLVMPISAHFERACGPGKYRRTKSGRRTETGIPSFHPNWLGGVHSGRLG